MKIMTLSPHLIINLAHQEETIVYAAMHARDAQDARIDRHHTLSEDVSSVKTVSSSAWSDVMWCCLAAWGRYLDFDSLLVDCVYIT